MASGSLAATLEQIRAALPGNLQSWNALLDDCIRALRAGRPDVALDDCVLREYSAADIAAFRAHVHAAVRAQLPQLSTIEAFLLSDWLAGIDARVTLQGEAALRLSERRFRTAIDRSSVAAFETDLIGHFTWL